MKNLFLIIILSASSSLCAQQKAGISTNEQTLTWIGKAAVGGYAPEGSLEIRSAEITYTLEEIITLSIVVDMASLKQENKQLQDHLKREDFFFVEQYPKATFELSKKAMILDGKCILEGLMAIRGESRKELIEVVATISEGKISLQLDHIMDRTRYGVNHNSPSIFKRLKENAIADQFVLKGHLEFQE